MQTQDSSVKAEGRLDLWSTEQQAGVEDARQGLMQAVLCAAVTPMNFARFLLCEM